MTNFRLFPFALALVVSAAIVASRAASAQVPACGQFAPGGELPVLLNAKLSPRTTLLCNDAYAVLASGITHGALWSAEHPTAASLAAARATPRQGQFHPDDRLPPADQAQIADYRRSGFDRGHMTPSGDMPDEQSQQQTFSLANMVPQTAALNRGIWAGIESAVRHLASREGELYLVTGPAFGGGQLQAIGPDGVLVPSATWKAVYDPRAGGAGGLSVREQRQAGLRGGLSGGTCPGDRSRPIPGAAGGCEGAGHDVTRPGEEPLRSKPTSWAAPPAGRPARLSP